MAILSEPRFESLPAPAVDISVDPQWSEAWWWLGIPVAVAAALFAVYAISPSFYMDYMHPEGYGILELSHFFVPLAGFVICAQMFFLAQVKAWLLLRVAVGIFAAACIFIAGEEMSWGQWFFYWDTPDFWAEVNRQKETNLHNSFYLLNQVPRVLLEVAIVIGGLLLPLWAGARNVLSAYPIMQILIPPFAIVPVSVLSVFFHGFKEVQKAWSFHLLPRPGEALETFFYMFILFYLIMLARRVRALGNGHAFSGRQP